MLPLKDGENVQEIATSHATELYHLKDGGGFVHKSALIELFYSEPWLSYVVWKNSASSVFFVTELGLRNLFFMNSSHLNFMSSR